MMNNMHRPEMQTVQHPQSNSQINKYMGLKSEPHNANGGIGVSYSNVMLGNIGNPLTENGATSYKTSYGPGQPVNQVPQMTNNYSHKHRFLNNGSQPVTGGAGSHNDLAFVKGIDFNSQDKYQYNILSNLPKGGQQQAQPGQGSLAQAGQQMLR